MKSTVSLCIFLAVTALHIIFFISTLQAFLYMLVPGYQISFFILGAFLVAFFMLKYLENFAVKNETQIRKILE